MGKKKESPPVGYHNTRYKTTPTEVIQGRSYKDRSTVCFTPTVGGLAPVRAYQSWNQLQKPMNQQFTQIFINNEEVGKAYEQSVDILRSNPELKKWKYVLTLEADNCPPPDGLLKLYDDMDASGFDVVGGLYWTKGEGGQPMCYGRTDVFPKDFRPWLPPPDSVAQCHGLGMGFTLFKMKVFLDEKFDRPMFKTEQSYDPQKGIKAYTQDLFFFEKAAKLGYRVGCSTRVLVGHYAVAEDKMW